MLSEDPLSFELDDLHTYEDYPEPWDLEVEALEPEDWEFEKMQEELREYFAMSPSQFVERTILVPDAHTKALFHFDGTTDGVGADGALNVEYADRP